MKTERIVLPLVLTTLILQGAILFRQNSGARPSRPAVSDAPADTLVDVAGFPVQGSRDAGLVLIEFSDYECPFCARHAAGVAKEIEARFVGSGITKHVFVNNPLPIHANAKLLASAAICAGNQGHYWEMHSLLFTSKPTTEAGVVETAQKRLAGLDSRVFQDCLQSSEPMKVIERDLELVKALAIVGTPSFAIGRVSTDGRVKIHKVVRGAQPMSVFEDAIDDVLKARS